MPWNTPATWTVGEEVTSALLNAQLRDNMNWLNVGSLWARARLTGTPPAVANNLDTLVPVNTVDAGDDPSGMFNATTHLMTVQAKGLYLITGGYRLLTSGNFQLACSLYKNASAGPPQFVGTNIYGTGAILTRTLALVPGDTIGLNAWQNTGGSVNYDLGFGGSGNYLAVACLARLT